MKKDHQGVMLSTVTVWEGLQKLNLEKEKEWLDECGASIIYAVPSCGPRHVAQPESVHDQKFPVLVYCPSIRLLLLLLRFVLPVHQLSSFRTLLLPEHSENLKSELGINYSSISYFPLQFRNILCSKMSTKIKRVVLSLNEKSEILEALNSGESGRSLAGKYGVRRATISDIKKNSESIKKFCEQFMEKGGNSQRKVVRTCRKEKLEEAVYIWFTQKRLTGQPVPGPLLCEKALDLTARLNEDPNFKASIGWLGNFKKNTAFGNLRFVEGCQQTQLQAVISGKN
ncbi:hypothetical protein M514_08571 [Trichuris suis]|uniref:HTH CENPB-type domain-containing protein n=1 Tax=Trichuris suis TaxID=68888 RepID=A0A085LZV7_9BILA|nr:hypothetical protein M513_08571 [Trichuris suis]KFD63474.1 hypothetical protein M514_08571 [Trichuris suis]